MTQDPLESDNRAPRDPATGTPDSLMSSQQGTDQHDSGQHGADAQWADEQPRDPRAAALRGLVNRCPRCGEGQLMQGFLTVNAKCAHCGVELGRYPAADGPAFFTMTIMLLVMIPLFAIVWNVWRPEPLTLLAVTGVIMTLLTLILLRLIKGAFVGYLWANDEQDRGA